MINLILALMAAIPLLITLWFFGAIAPWWGYSLLVITAGLTYVGLQESSGGESWGYLIVVTFGAPVVVFSLMMIFPHLLGFEWDWPAKAAYAGGSIAAAFGAVALFFKWMQ